jgi:hypothetical protein
MDIKRNQWVGFLLLISGLGTSFSQPSLSMDYANRIKSIGVEIAGLKSKYPQLDSFSVAAHVDTKRLKITYGYHTHAPKPSGGWSSGVPHPDPDGIWFYIDFHEPNSQAGIHTQPVTAPLFIGGKKVSYLILEGEKTRALNGDLFRILSENGVLGKTRAKSPDEFVSLQIRNPKLNGDIHFSISEGSVKAALISINGVEAKSDSMRIRHLQKFAKEIKSFDMFKSGQGNFKEDIPSCAKLSNYRLLYSNGEKIVTYSVDCPELINAVPANRIHGLILDLIDKVD